MALSPADVHNIAFSRPRIGKRGYNEQEVDLFIDLVERELIRHLEEEGELRSRNAELRNRDAGLQKREAELCQREAALHQHEREVHQQEEHLRHQEVQLGQRAARLAQRAAQLAKQGTPLPQQVAQLRYREAQVAQRESQIAQHEAQLAQHEAQLAQHEGKLRRQEAELGEWESSLREQDAEHERQDAKLAQRQAQLDQREAELRERQGELRRRLEQQEAVASCVGAEAAPNPAPRRGQQLRAAPKPAAVNGESRLQEARTVAAVHGRHDMERMAIRAVTDTLGNALTETVHERTSGTALDHAARDVGQEVALDEAYAELERLKDENADLKRSLGLLKSAAALLATALEQT